MMSYDVDDNEDDDVTCLLMSAEPLLMHVLHRGRWQRVHVTTIREPALPLHSTQTGFDDATVCAPCCSGFVDTAVFPTGFAPVFAESTDLPVVEVLICDVGVTSARDVGVT